MDHCERGHAVCRVGVAAGDVDVRVGCAADRDVRIPNAHVALLGAGHVDLQDDGTGRDVGNCEAHILDLGNANVAGVADLYDRLWIVGVAESATDAGYDGPGFSDYAGPWRNKQGGLYDVHAIGEVGDFAVGGVSS